MFPHRVYGDGVVGLGGADNNKRLVLLATLSQRLAPELLDGGASIAVSTTASGWVWKQNKLLYSRELRHGLPRYQALIEQRFKAPIKAPFEASVARILRHLQQKQAENHQVCLLSNLTALRPGPTDLGSRAHMSEGWNVTCSNIAKERILFPTAKQRNNTSSKETPSTVSNAAVINANLQMPQSEVYTP
ncbi:MAG: hypothetical protein Q9201_002555 [Fulgogasparrea decipioides]